MQTPIRRATRPSKAAIAPFSQAAARLIKLVQEEAREQLLNELSAKDSIIVLHGFDAETKRVDVLDGEIKVHDSKGNYIRMYRKYEEPVSWRGNDHMEGYWHPSRWYGYQTLVDASGIQWDRQLDVHVCDDFGNLVEVQGDAA